IALDRAAVGPFDDLLDIALRQRPVVGEAAVLRVGEPRRHLTAFDLGFDRACPGASLVVGQERHRRDLPRPMARLAIFLQNREHILGERGRGIRSPHRACHRGTDRHDRDEQSGSAHSFHVRTPSVTDPHEYVHGHVGDSFWTNSTCSTGVVPFLPPDADVDWEISPEISTFVPTNGESWLSSACRRYELLAAAAAATDVPVSGGTTPDR